MFNTVARAAGIAVLGGVALFAGYSYTNSRSADVETTAADPALPAETAADAADIVAQPTNVQTADATTAAEAEDDTVDLFAVGDVPEGDEAADDEALIRAGAGGIGERFDDGLSAIEGPIVGALETAGDTAAEVAEDVSDAGDEMGEAVTTAADTAGDAAYELAEGAVASMDDAGDAIAENADEMTAATEAEAVAAALSAGPEGTEDVSPEAAAILADLDAAADDADASSTEIDTSAHTAAVTEELPEIPAPAVLANAADAAETAADAGASAEQPGTAPPTTESGRFTRAPATAEDDAAGDGATPSAPTPMTRNPVRVAKADGGTSFTTNPRRAAKPDDGTYFTANKRRVAKADDGAYFTTDSQAANLNPCIRADGTRYAGPGTALNPFAEQNPCLPRATAQSFDVAGSPTLPLATASDAGIQSPGRFGLPVQTRTGIGSFSLVPSSVVGSDYREL